MKIEPGMAASLRRDFRRNVMTPVVAVVLFSLLGCALTAWLVTVQSNHKALQKQQQVIKNIFSQHLADFTRQHQNLLQSSDLSGLLSQPVLFGSSVSSLAGDDEIYLLDARQQPLAAWTAGKPSAPATFNHAAAELSPWLLATTVQAISSDFIRLNGRVAEIAAGSLSGSDAGKRLVFIRYLHHSFVDFLSHRGVVSHFRFTASQPGRANSAGFMLTSAIGLPVSPVSWQPMRPGSQMLMVTGPLMALAILSITLLCISMTRRLWQASLRLHGSLQRLEESEAHARQLAFHDALTGLPNRAQIEDSLNRHLSQPPVSGKNLALLLLDLDRFKLVNDTYGHPTGDELIVEVGQRLAALFPQQQAIGRLGGDEFVVMLSGITSDGEIARLCQQIISRLAVPMTLSSHTLWAGVSIGVALAPRDSNQRQDLMRKADIALYAAKAEGRGRYRFFATAMDEALQKRQQMAHQLRLALGQPLGLALWYQPIMATDGRKMVAVEALLRWNHPQLGSISPADFVPVAEETGLIIALGEWVIEQACRMATTCPLLIVAINVSPLQFLASGFVDGLLAAVNRHAISAHQIELEITEGVLLEDEQRALKTINTLRALGFCIALDDFGTGYSSLSYLIQFPVDTIKIDQAFTRALGVRSNSATIVKSVITLGHSLGITVTAEGVETAEQQAMLAEAGCDRLQGFLFSRPLSPDRLLAQLHQS